MNELLFQSIPAVLKENARRYKDRTAISYKKRNTYLSLTYGQFYERVLMLARGLRKAGVEPGDRVAIFSENRLGWAISDFGIQCAEAITVPIYATNTGEQAAYVINHSSAKVVFVSTRAQYEKLLSVRDRIPDVDLIISYERFLGDRSFPVFTQYQLSEVSHPLSEEEKEVIEAQIDAISLKDLITIIYTSGTTGVPKGVMLSQENILFDTIYGLKQLGHPLDRQETFLSFLPLSHVLERTGGYYAAIYSGSHIAFAENVQKVMENIIEIRPTAMVSVPRLFEKIYSRVYESVHQMPKPRQALFHYAVEVGKKYVRLKYIDKKPTGLLGLKYRFFDKLVFKKVRDRFGGKLRFFLCGGAPLDKTINEFMWAIGIPVFTGYGLTETSPALTLTNIRDVRFDAVGKPLQHTEVKVAADGELLVRGPQVMDGYYRNKKATEETFQDGWLLTGDIARVDEEGFVYIVDRKKEIIVTAGGKNIAPQPLENELKLDKYISQSYVFGDAKPYLVALLTPNIERLIDFAREEKLDYIDMEELVTHTRVMELYQGRVAEFNASLPSYETIKKFVLLPREFTIEGGEVTPTLKLKRKDIYTIYKDRIEEMYGNNGNGSNGKPETTHGGLK
ncbi:AMP-dependent synthetase/ligase [Desulfopila inferna]|uniref:AMP-dependent synthetase/ligase n=1 Tax=Desulfopila inferna TaxID=468528 RepID=UPI001966A44F|nr:long-chain fatty acid--CoA ligase [Desulfopila inferna]MBM9603503.1 long-chain fatty acid--CoA ligase [Desulfopila inferna]